ncbi:hypothetical protein PgNI_10846 [Pyricularia grisea]|uniref:Uncharacterized protein n=1 Tax=Pyricularia grisea TaxID=148305 RepID=A0A6P8AXH4_PYRGI|nr:hypothetical protein PgNI_10846 [Pyricularia grisea]TLD07037.1 hypothetical protein PgNI_10846 [Pyricularia grisea]
MYPHFLLASALLLSNSFTMAQWLYRSDSRDPDVIRECGGFKIGCPRYIPHGFEPFHYMQNNLNDPWGATWDSVAVAGEYLCRYAPFHHGWMYALKVKRSDVPPRIDWKSQPDISKHTWEMVSVFQRSGRVDEQQQDPSIGNWIENPDHRPVR